MLFYTTVATDKATKHQGGNKYTAIDIRIEDREEPKYRIWVDKEEIKILDHDNNTILLHKHGKGEKRKTT